MSGLNGEAVSPTSEAPMPEVRSVSRSDMAVELTKSFGSFVAAHPKKAIGILTALLTTGGGFMWGGDAKGQAYDWVQKATQATFAKPEADSPVDKFKRRLDDVEAESKATTSGVEWLMGEQLGTKVFLARAEEDGAKGDCVELGGAPGLDDTEVCVKLPKLQGQQAESRELCYRPQVCRLYRFDDNAELDRVETIPLAKREALAALVDAKRRANALKVAKKAAKKKAKKRRRRR